MKLANRLGSNLLSWHTYQNSSNRNLDLGGFLCSDIPARNAKGKGPNSKLCQLAILSALGEKYIGAGLNRTACSVAEDDIRFNGRGSTIKLTFSDN